MAHAASWRLVLRIAAVSASAGCSGESSFYWLPTDAGALEARYGETCRGLMVATDAFEVRCGRSAKGAHWIERGVIGCQLILADPNASYTEENVRECTANLVRADCSKTSAPCSFPHGKLATDAPCVDASQCASGECDPYSTKSLASYCGTCAEPTRANSCPDECLHGAPCDWVTDPFGRTTCRITRMIGESCVDRYDCQSLRCEYGVCVAAAAEGERCLLSNDCSSGWCSRMRCVALADLGAPCSDGLGPDPPCGRSLFCAKSRHCGRSLPARYGQPCGEHEGNYYFCVDDGVCAYSGNAAVCIPPAPDGAPCSTAEWLYCSPPATCIEGFCRYPNVSRCSR